MGVVAPSGYTGQELVFQKKYKLLGDVWSTDIAAQPGYNTGNYGIGSPTNYIEYTWDSPGGDSYPPGNYTARFGGTSAACPQVAGVAALLLTINPNFEGTLTNPQVQNVIKITADPMGSPIPNTDFGYGRTNAYKALKYAIEHYNTTLSGDIKFIEDITVNSGAELTLASGTTVRFANGKKLCIYGELNANAYGGNTITLKSASGSGPGIWQGVWFYSHNDPMIINIKVQNATYGFKLNSNSYVDCRSSTLTTNTWDVYANSADADFQSVQFTNNSTAGITVYTTPFGMASCSTSNPGKDGIQTQSSSPTIRSTTITGNYIGVKSSGGTVDLGTGCDQMYGGFNSIYSNSSYELWVASYTMLWALYDWWGQPSVPWSDIYAQGTANA